MKRTVLVVAPYLPLPANFGGALRIYHLVRALADTAEVILLAPVAGDAFDAVVELGRHYDVTAVPASSTEREPASGKKRLSQLRAMPGGRSHTARAAWSAKIQTVMDRLFQTRSIDLVQYEFPQSTLFRPPSPTPTVFDAHNVEYHLLQRVAATSGAKSKAIYNAIEFAKLRRFERSAWRRSTVCVATSTADSRRIEQATGQTVPVVPNGVDFAEFASAANATPDPRHLLFIGAMRHEPNAAGAVWFANDVLPLIERAVPDVRLTIAGADPPPAVRSLASATISVTGTVEDIRPYLARASTVIVPLHSGSGTRLKILEAFAARRPVVSTSIGAEGLATTAGTHLLLADTAQGFARAVIATLSNAELARTLAHNGQQLAHERYDWQAIAPTLHQAHELAIERYRSVGSEQPER